MARSKGVTIAVKIPVDWESMTKRTRQRLRQIVGRDTRVIHSFLGIIQQHEDALITGRNMNKIHDGELDKLTITAIKVKTGYDRRIIVTHDLKIKFPRISTNELSECRKTAVALYESYLELRRKRGRQASRPCAVNSTRRIPRWVFSQRFSLVNHATTTAKWWLSLRDSLDSVPEGRVVHDRLLIPLKMSPFHLNQIRQGEVKALQIFIDRFNKWWVSLAVRVNLPEVQLDILPPAVLGIDLGIEKAACTTLVTPTKVRETRYFFQTDKRVLLKQYDGHVAALQQEMNSRGNLGQQNDRVAAKLRKLRNKRENIAKEYDRVLVKQLVDYISTLSEKYTLYVSIGRLKNIRYTARRGNYRGRKFRAMVHSWAFARITQSLRQKLAQLGLKVDGKNPRFRIVPEAWTSIICWKCGTKGKRPKQNYFKCPSCGHQTNADRNGAINIAGRLITLTESLHSVRGLGKWAEAAQQPRKRLQLKTQRKTSKKSSKGKSLLSTKEQSSSSGESAAVHFVQSGLTSFSDGANESDNDPAVVSTVERLTVAESDGSARKQEEETRTMEGILSR
jgi:IS605 OrfB family transposase